jgi:hypothetical protein
MPSEEKSPVSERDAPMVMGVVLAAVEVPELGLVVLLALLELPELLHAARTPTDSIAAALRARAFLEDLGRWGLMPVPSLLVRVDLWLGFAGIEPVGHVRMLTDE